jgi:hypothetical protein
MSVRAASANPTGAWPRDTRSRLPHPAGTSLDTWRHGEARLKFGTVGIERLFG